MFSKHITGAVFNCMDCDKHWEGYEDARIAAYNHSKKTGHKTNGETVYAYDYP